MVRASLFNYFILLFKTPAAEAFFLLIFHNEVLLREKATFHFTFKNLKHESTITHSYKQTGKLRQHENEARWFPA